MRVIGFAGRKYNGKDTAAQVVESSPYGYHKMNFSDPVKEIVGIMFGLTKEEMSDPILKQTKLDRWPFQTPRELMQFIGNGIRETYPDMWVQHWMRRKSDYANYVITDVRYHNEVKMVHDYGGVVIKIKNPRIELDEFSNNRSETESDNLQVDALVINDGTIEQLHEKVRKAVRALT